MSSFLPASTPELPPDVIEGDGFYPSLTVADFYSRSGITGSMPLDVVLEGLGTATSDTRYALSAWRADRADSPLSGDQAEDYRKAVFSRARALILELKPDYHTTKDALDRAEAAAKTAQTYYRLAYEAQCRLMGIKSRRVRLV